MRDWGVAAALADLPGWVHTILAGLTTLGDPLTILSLATLVYWLIPSELELSRPEGARLAVTTLVGLVLIPITKAALAEPRPPMTLWAITTDGYGLPSGHVTAAATFSIATALLSDRGRAIHRWGIAIGFTVLIAITRVGLGVHYLGDVVLGALLGTVCAVAIVEVTRRRIRPGLLVALGIAILGAVVTGLTLENPMGYDAALALGGSVGATVAWLGLDWVGADFTDPKVTTLLFGAVTALLGGGIVAAGEGVGIVLIGSAIAGLAITGVPRLGGIP